MLEADHEQIPDLPFAIEILIAQPPHVASRLRFDVTPKAEFLNLPVNERRVTFCENVFYKFSGGLIQEVWSVVDKATIEAQLR
jgi:predicted ester cyclase